MIPIGQPGGGATLNAPIEHLGACHRRIEERLDTLERVVPFLTSQTDDALAAIASAFRFLDVSGGHHTADEEESFFPRLAAQLSGSESEFLRKLQDDHRRVESVYEELKACVSALPLPPPAVDVDRYSELTRTLTALYREHIRQEEARFPEIAHRILSESDLQAISAEMKRRRGI